VIALFELTKTLTQKESPGDAHDKHQGSQSNDVRANALF
jgi:hypothetical protein